MSVALLASDVYSLDDLNLGLLLLRLLLGLLLAAHGYAKIRNGLEGTAGWFESEGLRPGALHARLAAGTEMGAGLAVALGFLFPLSPMAVIGVMTVAGYVGHRRNGFFSVRNGWEFTFVLGSVAAVLATTGPGEWSVDNAYDWFLTGWGGLLIAAVGGVGAAVLMLKIYFTNPDNAAAQAGDSD